MECPGGRGKSLDTPICLFVATLACRTSTMTVNHTHVENLKFLNIIPQITVGSSRYENTLFFVKSQILKLAIIGVNFPPFRGPKARVQV